jgi:putative DNA primase/helicase
MTKIQNNRQLKIATAGDRFSINWQTSELSWAALVDRLRAPIRTPETYAEYVKLGVREQSNLKDVGGFVGGALSGTRRKAANVTGRDLVALDFDNIESGATDTVIKRVRTLGCAAAIYSTRKHAGHAPRLRILLPSDRTMTTDEYEPIARKLADRIGIEWADPTTFEAVRLMYWPSVSSDSEYVFEVIDKPFFSADGVLQLYEDWTDVRTWPQTPGAEMEIRKSVARAEDPTEKRGIIGAFCRTYNIHSAIEKFIPKVYESGGSGDRYTYLGGSTQGGAVVYDDGKFLYSHHATDPTSGQLVNAWDLIRLHRFAELDDEAKQGTPVVRLPSSEAMKQFALEDEPTAHTLRMERTAEALNLFEEVLPEEEAPEEALDVSWINQLTLDANGKFQKTIQNIVTTLEHDPMLAGKIGLDEFSNRGIVLGALPWDPSTEFREWRDVDDAGLLCYLEKIYGFTGEQKVAQALLLTSYQNRIHEVRAYLQGLAWDGVARLDTLLSVYLGAEDNAYTRAVMRKSLCAAVARVSEPGAKYDYMPIFTGPQGIGKSTFLAILAGEWFSDSLATFTGKEAAEMLQGVWINEIGELTALSRQETGAVKQFLSKRDDVYREAYGRRTSRFPRQCVFFGTSNDQEFLRDATGNRRFWPVEVGIHKAQKSIWNDLPKERDQIWAEAVARYQIGEPLFLTGEVEQMSRDAQAKHKETSGLEGYIIDFLEKDIPLDWDSWTIDRRKMFWRGQLKDEFAELVPRDKVCAAEIWVECLNGDVKYMKRMDSVQINNILLSLDGWERNKSVRRYGPHGRQKGFERPSTLG